MLSAVEAALRTRCADNESLRLLIAQWEYDRRLLGQALSTVAHAFPHYSLHYASHSETILERIAAMMGADSLSKLSATDLWLLLEAAYLHDSGMVVLESTRRKDLSSDEFESHIRATVEGVDPDLAARAMRIQGRQTPNDLLDILEGHLDLLLVYAEFVRRRHAQRSEHVALSPLETARVESPRTVLLPSRLWHIIGRICRAHGENREFIIQELPMQESGVGGEICHPRFVACMLRLGDLLDLDSDRFCPTINATISEFPRVSEAHRRKHAGIPSAKTESCLAPNTPQRKEHVTWTHYGLDIRFASICEIAPQLFWLWRCLAVLQYLPRVETRLTGLRLEGRSSNPNNYRPKYPLEPRPLRERV